MVRAITPEQKKTNRLPIALCGGCLSDFVMTISEFDKSEWYPDGNGKYECKIICHCGQALYFHTSFPPPNSLNNQNRGYSA